MYEANLYSAYESRQHETAKRRPSLPVTLVTGFLGSGKTTLLLRILQKRSNLKIAAIVNEYSTVDHDGEVLALESKKSGNSVSTSNSMGRSSAHVKPVQTVSGGCFCCATSLTTEFKNQVFSLLDAPDYLDDKPDYLVVETSGVTDPATIISALDQRFGKLARARLDCVVTVVDAEVIANKIMNNTERGSAQSLGVAQTRQLRDADVILVNKNDLIGQDERIKLTETINLLNPGAAVHFCSQCDVPLHYVLDLVGPDACASGVSHESVTRLLCPSLEGGGLRQQHEQNVHANMNGSGNGHLAEDALVQVTYTSCIPLHLGLFQDWIMKALPEGLVRAKGILAFSTNPRDRLIFNLSGKRRISLEDGGAWEGQPKIHLVMIGTDLQADSLLNALKSMETTTQICTEVQDIQDSKDIISNGASTAGWFEYIDPTSTLHHHNNNNVNSGVVMFRFTGQSLYRLSPLQLRVKHGVDLDAINRAIAQAVNCGGKIFISFQTVHICDEPSNMTSDCEQHVHHTHTAQHTVNECMHEHKNCGNSVVVLRYGLGGTCCLREIFDEIIMHTRAVLAKELSYITGCNCHS